MQLLPTTLRRRASTRSLAVLMLCAASLGGCASVAETMIAPQDEYLAYRRVRNTVELEQRLAAAWNYVERFPHGRWIGEVRPWFLRAELDYFERRRESAAGLAAYLAVLPTGPHAEEARGALAVRRARAQKDRAEQLGLAARYTEERLAVLALERERAREVVPLWLGRWLAIDTWGERTSHLDSETLYAWRLDPPGARCEEDTCTRSITLPYSMPGGGDDAARVMVLDVVLRLRDGGVAEARLEGPALFSRMYEASTSRRVIPGDAVSRVDAIAFAVEVVRGAAEARMPRSRCGADAVAPVVLSLACDGWTLEMRAAEDPAQDDIIAIAGPKRR
jgi:hypothetical protein